MSLNLGMIGFGRMGKAVARLGEERGHTIGRVFEIDSRLSSADTIDKLDVLIDFSEPDAVLSNVRANAQGKPMVIGTTGWMDDFVEVEALAEASGMGLIYASNFSLGMHLFFKIAEHAAGLFNSFEEYDAFIHEIHHRGKIDSPSGTALSLGNILVDRMTRKSEIVAENLNAKIRPEQLHVTATRAGHVPGTHKIAFDSSVDSIELIHMARDRSGFALGAVLTAEWIVDKQGLFTMDDYLSDVLDHG